MPVEKAKVKVPVINVNRFILLLKQTKLISQKEINEVKTIVKKMNRGANLTNKQKTLYTDVATKASINPMSNSFVILNQTKTKLRKMMATGEIEQQAKK